MEPDREETAAGRRASRSDAASRSDTADRSDRTSRTSRLRQRGHEASAAEIKRVARRVMAAEGSTALKLSAVARELEVVPSALYRYFRNREDLLDAVVVDAYAGLADSVDAAMAATAGRPAAERIVAGLVSWRRWALANPTDFTLIFGSPVPGFSAGEGSREPAQRVGRPFMGPIVELLEAGPGPGPTLRAAAEAMAPFVPTSDWTQQGEGMDLSGPAGALLLSGLASVVGHLSREVFGTLPFEDAAARAALYRVCVASLLQAAGLTPADAQDVTRPVA